MPQSLQDRMFRQVNSAFADRLQQRSRRRLIVVATIAAAIGVGFGIASGGDDIVYVSIASVPFWLCMVLLNLSLRGIFELDDAHLDEHQIAVRNHAYKTAYGFTLVFLVLVVTIASVVELDRIRTFALAASVFLICALLPRLITAWTAENGDDEE